MPHQKNETVLLLGSLLITGALLAGGYYWWGSSQRSIQAANSQSVAIDSATAKSFAQVQNVPAGLFRYGGSTVWVELKPVDEAMQIALPEFKLRYVLPISGVPSSGLGIKMVIEGQAAFAQSSRPFTSEENEQAKQRGFQLQQVAVAIDGVAVAVNPSLDVSGLTLSQLKDIYTGQITNWKQVGGADLPITPISHDPKLGGTIQEILAGQAPSASLQVISTTTEGLRKLSSTPGGIFMASAPQVVPQCSVKPLAIGMTPSSLVPPYAGALVTSCSDNQRNQVNTEAFQSSEYPLTRNLFVIIKQNGQVEQQAGEAYANLLLSEQGQAMIAEAGFVRIR